MAQTPRVGDDRTAWVVQFVDTDQDPASATFGEQTPVSLATVTLVEIRFKKPDGRLMVRTAHVLDAAQGRARYISSATDIDVAGDWRVAGRMVSPEGEFTTNPERVEVGYRLT